MGPISPSQYLGFSPGDDRKLATWSEITGYFKQLVRDSRRIRWFDMGETTEGRPFYYLCITSPENLGRLEELRLIQARLADPRGLSEAEAEELLRKARTMVMISCSIHATEVGAAQMSMQLAYDLETASDPGTMEILDNVVLLLVPSLNPDGLDLVVDWYKKTLGTPWEGTAPPYLYHKYAGHDNNRDWFMLNLVETRLTVEKIHNVWHPHIVYDLHQMGDSGFRMFVPPYLDPYDPNVDYILRQEIAELGLHMMGELLSAGKSGVSCYNGYDAFAPSRAYQHYHGGVRILSEAASARIATPVTRKREELKPTRDGSDPREASWNHPLPWPGGEWRLKDIVEYELIACRACLTHAARFRDSWVRNFYLLSKRACERSSPYAFVIPADQPDPVAVYELLKVLWDGQVEIHRSKESFEVNGKVFSQGSFVVKLAQPYGAYAKTLLEIQKYPDLRQYPGGPPKLPYDVTGHTLPLLMGVKAFLAEKPFCVPLEKLEELPRPVGGIDHRTEKGCVTSREKSNAYFALPAACNWSFKVANELLARGVEVYRTARTCRVGTSNVGDVPELLPAGTFLIPEAHGEIVDELCRRSGVSASMVDASGVPLRRLRKPRIGVYKSYVGLADEGWLRYVLERYGFEYQSITNQAIRRGSLARDYDIIIFPSQSAAFIRDGHRPGSYPPEYTGGLGNEGKEEIASFVERGGSCMFVAASSDWAITEMGLPCSNVLADKKPQEFFAPGSILRVMVDPDHPLGYGLPRELPVMFERGQAWDADSALVVARFPAAEPLLSGWLLGAQYLSNKAALAEYRVGLGRVVLVAFHPYFRGQARNTYKVVFNACYESSVENSE